jgi:hypothetical protein
LAPCRKGTATRYLHAEKKEFLKRRLKITG